MSGPCSRAVQILVIAAVAAPLAAGSVSARVSPPAPPLPAALEMLGGPSSFAAPISRIGGQSSPELVFAQRAIDRRWGEAPAPAPIDDATEYTYIEVEGWKSPMKAAAMSAVLPGTGQWYTGSSGRYVFLGVEALALYSYFHFRAESEDRREASQAYAGDPNDPNSRWSFSQYEAGGNAAESERLREVYHRDRREFYSLISSDDRYLEGWHAASQEPLVVREGFVVIDDERRDATRKSRFGMFAAVANRVISVVEAFRGARLNNFQIEEDLRLKVNARAGSNPSFKATLTKKF